MLDDVEGNNQIESTASPGVAQTRVRRKYFEPCLDRPGLEHLARFTPYPVRTTAACPAGEGAVAAALISVTIHYDCPLTNLEKSLRRRGGEIPYRNGFVDHYLTGHVYPHGADLFVQLLVALCIVVAYAHIVSARRGRRGSSGRRPQSITPTPS